MARKILWGSLFVLPSLSLFAHYVVGVGQVADFVFAALALLPLAWVIGEATEHAAEHTGPGIGGFLNASFGNAPELIIALIAVSDGLRGVVRGTIAGSVVSNLLLVLGIALAVGHGDAHARRVDRRSLLVQLGLVLVAVAAFMFTSVPGLHGVRDRHALAVGSVPVALLLLGLYVAVTVHGLRRHRRLHAASGEIASESDWSLAASLTVLGAATVVTALVSEILVHSLAAFADAVGLSTFFTAAVIVAIVGNAAEHGGAVVIAWRGKFRLPSEIAVSSAAQVALLVAPLVALLSFVVRPPLALAFRPVELATMGGAAILVALVVRDERVRRWEGFMLLAAYGGCILLYWFTGDLPD